MMMSLLVEDECNETQSTMVLKEPKVEGNNVKVEQQQHEEEDDLRVGGGGVMERKILTGNVRMKNNSDIYYYFDDDDDLVHGVNKAAAVELYDRNCPTRCRQI